MTGYRKDIGAEEIVRALLEDPSLQFQDMGSHLRKGICPSCGKKELWISKDKPWRVNCNRGNNCGYTATTKELLPEVFANFAEKYAPTEREPNRTADAVLGFDRGFDLSKIRGWYEQAAYTFPGTNIMCHTIRFYLDKAKTRYWERLIDKTKKDGQKNNIGGQRKADGSVFKGDAWFPPGLTLEKNDRCFLVEGIFHSIGLLHHEIKAAAGFSCNNFPINFIEEHKGKGITWVIALDGDPAGRKWAKAHAKRLKKMGEKFQVLILPDNDWDWDDYYRMGRISPKFINERLHHGRLFMAQDVHEKAYHMYCHSKYSRFILDFRNALYSISVKRDVLETELANKKREDGEQEPEPIELVSQKGEEIFFRNHYVDQISNVHPRFLYMEKDDVMDERYYVFDISYSNGAPREIIRLEGNHVAAPDAFNKALLKRSSAGTFDGDAKQFKTLRDRWFNSDMRRITSLPFVGYDRDTQAYVYQHAAYFNGREIALNRDGYFQVGKTGIKTSLNGVSIITDGEFQTDWLDNYFAAFHWQGLTLLAFWLGSLFAQQIRAEHKSWPFFEFTGEPGAGKSTALEFLWKLFGRDDYEGFDVMKATPAGRRRAFNQVSNMPVVIIESDRDDGSKDAKAKQFDFDLCKPFFNGRGTGTLGVARRNNDVEESLFQAALVISQNAEVDGSEALLQRVVHVHVDKKHHRPDSRDIARWFERQTSNEVGGFLRKALKHERQILDVYRQSFRKYEEQFGKSEKIRNERIVKNHAQVAAFGDALEVIFPSMNKRRQADLAKFILARAEIREQRLAHDHPVVEQFWESYHYLNSQHPTKADDFLNHAHDDSILAINLPQFTEMCQKHGQERVDQKVLKKLLPHGKRHKFVECRMVSSKHLEREDKNTGKMVARQMRCWVFQKD